MVHIIIIIRIVLYQSLQLDLNSKSSYFSGESSAFDAWARITVIHNLVTALLEYHDLLDVFLWEHVKFILFTTIQLKYFCLCDVVERLSNKIVH